MIAIIALLIQILTMGLNNQASAVMVIPAKPDYQPSVIQAEYESGCMCDDCYWTECFTDAAEEFDAIFNAIETKWSKNGRLMIKPADSKTFKFAKKG
jgi:hypothetical protein